MKKLIYSIIVILVILSGCYSGSQTTSGNRYYVPDWAPVYEPGVRYYYIPDIETYYDVTNGNYIYRDRGMWIFSRDLPPMYRGYNLHNGFQVVIDRNVYEPWRYHQNYVTSYPRYYYRDVYSNRSNERIRGYNENAEKPVYKSPSNNYRRSNTNPSGRSSRSNRETRSSDYSNRRSGSMEEKSSDARQPSQRNPSGTSSRRQNQSTYGSGTGSQNESSGEVQQQNERSSSTNGESRSGQSRSTESGTESGNSNREVQEQRKNSATSPAVENTERRKDSNSGEEKRSSRRK